MSVKYNKFFKKLIDMEISPVQLIQSAKCSPNILSHLKKNEYISMSSLEKICLELHCGADEILEFVKDELEYVTQPIKIASLFSGIGGFEEGLKLANIKNEVVFASEIDESARKSYSANFEAGNLFGDITTINECDIPEHNLLLAGFPCQSFSIAGRQKGFDDIRGTLFFDVARILNEKHPKFVLLENVKNLISHDKSRTINVILSTLNNIGYTVDFTVINSCEAGVPQNRDRTYIFGVFNGKTEKYSTDKRSLKADTLKRSLNKTDFKGFNFFNDITFDNPPRYIENILEDEVPETFFFDSKEIQSFLLHNKYCDVPGNEKRIIKLFDLPREVHNDLERQRRVYSVKGISPTVLARADSTKILICKNGISKIRKITPTENFYIQGFSQDFVHNIKSIGMSNTQMYKQSGNAVSPPVIAGITKKINENYLIGKVKK